VRLIGYRLRVRAVPYIAREREISPEDVKKEGYNSLEEFRKAWIEINASWDPEQIVTVYEFKFAEK